MTTLSIEHPFQLPEDDWFHIAPVGEFDHASGVRQIVDGQACRAMADQFSREAAAPNFPGLLVDFDHFSQAPDKTSAAAGWITALRAVEPGADPAGKEPGLWAQVRWSDLGDAALRGGRYRLVSPVWNRSDCETVAGGDSVTAKEKVRPLRLSRVALTNDPNLQGLVPLTNRTESKVNNMNYKLKLVELLGLKPDATDEQIAAAAEARLKEVQLLQQRYGALLATRVEDDLREFSSVIGDADVVRGQLLANREASLQILRALRAPRAEPVGRAVPLHNRATTRVPDPLVPGDKQEEARARRIANRAREIQRQLGVGHRQAFEMACGEVAKAA